MATAGDDATRKFVRSIADWTDRQGSQLIVDLEDGRWLTLIVVRDEPTDA